MGDATAADAPEGLPAELTTHEVATFVARGFLEFPGAIPDAINLAAIDELDQISSTWGTPERPFAPDSGTPFAEIYPEPSALGEVLRHPTVTRIVRGLVGDDCVFDHDFVHLRPPHDPSMQALHADAVIDPNTAFDIQVFYFPQRVEPGAGGTGFVPGTHLRRVHETQVGRYRHLLGEREWSGPAGSILVFHHGLWHRGMPNRSDRRRVMYKIRLNPTRPQVRRWDTSDLDAVQNDPRDHIFARFDLDKVGMTLRRSEPWMGVADHRLEQIERAKLWRYLTGDDGYDLDWYLTRLAGRADLAATAP